jgi:hypothetical protein
MRALFQSGPLEVEVYWDGFGVFRYFPIIRDIRGLLTNLLITIS